MKIIYQEQSQQSRSTGPLITFLILVFIGFVAYTTYRSVEQHIILISEYFIEFVSMFVIMKQALSTYTYILTEDRFIIEEKTIFRKKHFELPYEIIDGVYPFRQEFMGQLKFRYKYRKSSTSDPRLLYAMAYAVINGNKVQHGRVLIKADDAFYETLEQFLPNRVRVSQEEIVYYAVVRKDAVKHGEDVAAYLASFEAGVSAEDENTTVPDEKTIETDEVNTDIKQEKIKHD